jgi:hypothetical protein
MPLLRAVVLALFLVPAYGMTYTTFIRDGGVDLEVSGIVDPRDLQEFPKHARGARSLVLTEIPGGDMGTAFILAEYIRSWKLPVVVDGRCLSACAIMYVAGVKRSFRYTSRLAPSVGFHGAVWSSGRLTGQPAPMWSARAKLLVMRMTDSRLPTALLSRAFYELYGAGNMLIVMDNAAWIVKDGVPVERVGNGAKELGLID